MLKVQTRAGGERRGRREGVARGAGRRGERRGERVSTRSGGAGRGAAHHVELYGVAEGDVVRGRRDEGCEREGREGERARPGRSGDGDGVPARSLCVSRRDTLTRSRLELRYDRHEPAPHAAPRASSPSPRSRLSRSHPSRAVAQQRVPPRPAHARTHTELLDDLRCIALLREEGEEKVSASGARGRESS